MMEREFDCVMTDGIVSATEAARALRLPKRSKWLKIDGGMDDL